MVLLSSLALHPGQRNKLLYYLTKICFPSFDISYFYPRGQWTCSPRYCLSIVQCASGVALGGVFSKIPKQVLHPFLGPAEVHQLFLFKYWMVHQATNTVERLLNATVKNAS